MPQPARHQERHVIALVTLRQGAGDWVTGDEARRTRAACRGRTNRRDSSCFPTWNQVEKPEVVAEGVRMKVAIWSEPDDVEAALARLGLAVAPLVVAVNRGYLAAISRTANDAPNAAGFYQWNETLRAMREELALFGFTRSDAGSYSTALRSDKRMAIAVSSGDEGTGVAAATPSTKQGKGPRTIAAVSSNATQLELFPGEIMMPPPADDIDCLTWILLFRAAATELRAELSLPVTMNDGGQISAWRERIILPSQPLDTPFSIPEPDFGPELEIKIQRRT